jgi:secreted PhoX family phosphatase
MSTLGRRKFMITGGSATVALSLATLGRNRSAVARGPWGALIPDPEGILDLPAGFGYQIVETAGDDMDDGYRVPGAPDGMACFQGPGGTLILMRNHELGAGDLAEGPYKLGQVPPTEAYEAAATGGVTRVVIDETTYERISSNLVLVGTIRNCAGGMSPWGWLTCEESTAINGGTRHGYTFLCPIDAETVQAPQRIDGYGRYNHEAACVDPSTNYAYLTEDRGDSCLYRFVPEAMDDPFVGTLQALRIVGQDGYDTNDMTENDVLDVAWVDIDNPDPNSDSVREEAQGKGAATFVRGEGIWFFEGQIYICSTSGGPAGSGQIFRLIDGNAPTLELVVRSTDSSVLESPDNITVAPWGEVFMAEDGDGDNYIRWVNDMGEICDFARNALSDSEHCGVCFSPDGQAMFVNIQGDGLTLVITGPFPMGGGGDGDGDGDGDTGDGDGDPGDGDGDPGDGDGDPGDGDGDGGGNEDTDGGNDGLGEGDTGGTGTGTSGDAGIEDGDGCNCSTQDSTPPGLASAAMVAATLAVTVGLRSLLVHDVGDDTLGD